MVVDHVGEVVGGHTVLLDEHHIVHAVAVREAHFAEYQVIVRGSAVRGGVHADHVRHARVQFGLHFLFGKVQAVLVVLEHLALGFRRRPALVDLFLGAEAVIGRALLHQLLGVGQVQALALALDIGAEIAAHVRALVPNDAAVPQGIVNHLGRAFHEALLVGVLDAQDEFSAHLFGEQISVQRRAHAAQVHEARGRRGKAGANLCHKETSLLFFVH